ncbi:MAG: iron ABC transporter permease, partial [Lentisphaeria bacterium]|nr:iron ABC transporter permease [Lentisphaeria bacterium]
MLKLTKYAVTLLTAAFLVVFLILPVGTVILGGMSDLQLIQEVFANAVYVQGLVNSFKIAVVTTFFVFLIALPMALVYDSFDFPGKGLAHIAAMIPMILPPFVGALGFQQILGHFGVINTILVNCGFSRVDFLTGDGRFWSICLIEALHLYPILYLNLVSSLGNIDPAMRDAARNMGAGFFRRLFCITIPMIRPGILAGGSLVLIWSFTELGTPLMFGYTRVTAVQIFNGLTELKSNPEPFALVLVMLVISTIMYLLAKLLLRSEGAGSSKGTAGTSAERLNGWKKYLPTLFFAVITFLAALPHIALIFTSFSLKWQSTILPENWTVLNYDNALSH